MSSEQNPDPTQTPPETAPEPPETAGGGNAEAAKWRRQLRETEADRDGLRTRLDERDRAEVDRLLADRLQVPGDAWLDPAFTLDAMRADDGTIDMQKVETEVARLEKERPHWKKAERVMPNMHHGAREPAPSKGPSFGESVRKALGG